MYCLILSIYLHSDFLISTFLRLLKSSLSFLRMLAKEAPSMFSLASSVTSPIPKHPSRFSSKAPYSLLLEYAVGCA